MTTPDATPGRTFASAWAFALVACGARVYPCADDSQCDARSGGVCVADGRCAYADGDCDGGLRYGEHAGDRSGQCVPADPGDSDGGSGSDSGTIPDVEGTIWYVAPHGDDAAAGTQSDPFRTIARALDAAQAGDGVSLAAGTYEESVRTRRHGSADAPIAVFGPREAVLRSPSTDPVVEIRHDHHALFGLTIDGALGDLDAPDDYADTLVSVWGAGTEAPNRGTRLVGLALRRAGGECVRLRYFTVEAEIAGNEIRECGRYFYLEGETGENGEGIFVGTPMSDWADNPTDEPDASNDHWIHDNDIDTAGNECIDVQEGARGSVIERNRCTGQKDIDSAGIDARGDANTIRANEVFGCAGAGVRVGSEGGFGLANEVVDNDIHDNMQGGVKIQASPQAAICGNTFADNGGADAIGDFAEDYDPAAPC